MSAYLTAALLLAAVGLALYVQLTTPTSCTYKCKQGRKCNCGSNPTNK